MKDSLANPIQCMEADTKIDLRPIRFYLDDEMAQMITFGNGLVLSIKYEGPLPSFHVHRPTPDKYNHRDHANLTEKVDWNPYNPLHQINNVIAEF